MHVCTVCVLCWCMCVLCVCVLYVRAYVGLSVYLLVWVGVSLCVYMCVCCVYACMCGVYVGIVCGCVMYACRVHMYAQCVNIHTHVHWEDGYC